MSMVLGLTVGIAGAAFALFAPVSGANGCIFVAIEFLALILVVSQP